MALFGSDAKTTNIPRYNPQQIGQLNQLAQMGLGGLQQNQKNFNIDAIQNQARKQFNTETVPTIANRFLAGNTRNSSGFQSALASGGADLEAALAGLRNQYGQQQQQNFMQQAQLGLQPQYESIYEPENIGFGGQLLTNSLPALLRGGSALATGGGSEGVSGLIQLLQYLLGGRGQQ